MTGFTTFNFGVISGGGSVRAVVGTAPLLLGYLVVGGGGQGGSGANGNVLGGGGGAGGVANGTIKIGRAHV